MENIKIVPLSEENMEGALSVLHKCFSSFNSVEDPNKWFPATLAPEKYADLYRGGKVVDCRYFVVIDTKQNKPIGTTGIYHLEEDPPTTAWVGWYCIDPDYQGKGIGKEVLRWTIDKAKTEGNSALKLYTRPGYDAALALYDKFGFKDVGEEEYEGEMAVYKELSLKD